MKKLFSFLLLASAMTVNAQTMKMVIDKDGEVVGRYLSTKGDK